MPDHHHYLRHHLGRILSCFLFIQISLCCFSTSVYAQDLIDMTEEQQILAINQILLDISNDLNLGYQYVLPGAVTADQYQEYLAYYEQVRQYPCLVVTYYHRRDYPEIAATYMNNITINLDNLLSVEDAAMEGVSVEYYAVQSLAHEMRHVYQFAHMYDDTDYGRACLASAQGNYIAYWEDVEDYQAQFVEQDAETYGYQYADTYVGRTIYAPPSADDALLTSINFFMSDSPVNPIDAYNASDTLLEEPPMSEADEGDSVIQPIIEDTQFTPAQEQLPDISSTTELIIPKNAQIFDEGPGELIIPPQYIPKNQQSTASKPVRESTEALESIPAQPVPQFDVEYEYIIEDIPATAYTPALSRVAKNILQPTMSETSLKVICCVILTIVLCAGAISFIIYWYTNMRPYR